MIVPTETPTRTPIKIMRPITLTTIPQIPFLVSSQSQLGLRKKEASNPWLIGATVGLVNGAVEVVVENEDEAAAVVVGFTEGAFFEMAFSGKGTCCKGFNFTSLSSAGFDAELELSLSEWSSSAVVSAVVSSTVVSSVVVEVFGFCFLLPALAGRGDAELTVVSSVDPSPFPAGNSLTSLLLRC